MCFRASFAQLTDDLVRSLCFADAPVSTFPSSSLIFRLFSVVICLRSAAICWSKMRHVSTSASLRLLKIMLLLLPVASCKLQVVGACRKPGQEVLQVHCVQLQLAARQLAHTHTRTHRSAYSKPATTTAIDNISSNSNNNNSLGGSPHPSHQHLHHAPHDLYPRMPCPAAPFAIASQ